MFTLAFSQKVMQSMIDHATSSFNGPLDGTYLGLFTATTGISPQMTLSNFTEAAFTGYARAAAGTWVGPLIPPGANYYAVLSQQVVFESTSGASNELEIGWLLADAISAGNVVAAGTFDSPIPIVGNGAGFAMSLTVWYDPQANNWAITIAA